MNDNSIVTTTLGGGCFWCLEAVFLQAKGIRSVVSGYAGGPKPNPTYREVCSGTTGHAEVVQVGFDPNVISFHDVLGVFFSLHDPTTLNRQGGDVGTQYRSVIFFESEEQEKQARAFVVELETEKVFDGPVVTEISPLDEFFPAEDYHQRYFERNPAQPYCQAVVAPKVAKFRKQYVNKLLSPA